MLPASKTKRVLIVIKPHVESHSWWRCCVPVHTCQDCSVSTPELLCCTLPSAAPRKTS